MTDQDQPIAAEAPIAAPEGAAPAELLVAALATFQRDCPTIPKTKTATVRMAEAKGGGTYTYQYADLADVLGIVRPLLARNGLVVVQYTTRDAGKVILVTELRHVGGGALTSEVDLGRDSASPQAFGGALTYLRRYELTTLLGIAAEDDTDAQHVERPSSSSAPAPAALPAWAQPATPERQGEWVKALEPIIGEAKAIELGEKITGAWGAFPSGAVVIARGIVAALQPSPSAPPPDGDIPVDVGPPPPGVGGDLPLDDLEVQARAGEEPQVEPAEEPPADAEERLRAAMREAAPSSIPLPLEELRAVKDGPTADDERRGILKAHGCLCADPLGPDGAKNTACPITGHGIPF